MEKSVSADRHREAGANSYQSHLEFRLLGRKADAEILITDHTDYTDRGRFGFLCICAIGVIRG